MAEHSSNAHGPHPAANVDEEHRNSYQMFVKGTKWSVIGIIIVAALLAIFRTHNGMP